MAPGGRVVPEYQWYWGDALFHPLISNTSVSQSSAMFLKQLYVVRELSMMLACTGGHRKGMVLMWSLYALSSDELQFFYVIDFLISNNTDPLGITSATSVNPVNCRWAVKDQGVFLSSPQWWLMTPREAERFGAVMCLPWHSWNWPFPSL